LAAWSQLLPGPAADVATRECGAPHSPALRLRANPGRGSLRAELLRMAVVAWPVDVTGVSCPALSRRESWRR